MEKGLDTATPLTQNVIDEIVNTGYTFVVRYYCTNPLNPKRLTQGEAGRLSNASIRIVSVFQNYNNDISSFSAESGRLDAYAAYDCAVVVGQPVGSAIYFAVDFDAGISQIKGLVREYFEEVRDVFACKESAYRIGVYGSGSVCRYIKDERQLAEYSWLSMSTGWRGYRDYIESGLWNLKQIKGISLAGVEFDTNTSNQAGCGWWSL